VANAPLDPDLVAQAIANHLWNEKFAEYPPSSFLIKGSYAASVLASQKGMRAEPLPYNDIDVFVEVPYHHKRCEKASSPKTTSVSSEQGIKNLIPGSNAVVQVSVLCELDPKYSVLHNSDINGVVVGFTVHPSKEDDSGRPVTAKVGEWIYSESFEDFLRTNTLRIEDRTYMPAVETPMSIIRLMHKAEQLKAKYSLPDDDDELTKLLHDGVINRNYKNKFDRLSSEESRDKILSRFDLLPVQEGRWFQFARKGMELPAGLPRRLSNATYSSIPQVGNAAGGTVPSSSTTSGGGSSVGSSSADRLLVAVAATAVAALVAASHRAA